jgi:glycosyltransferase involved in cell wall biosynthesis
MKHSTKCIFYGALGKNKKFTVGGGESGNLRTIYLLEQRNIEVIKVYKPYPIQSILGYILYAFQLFFNLLTFIFVLISNPKTKVVHISGFYNVLIYYEYFLVLFTRFFNKKCIYELRGGDVIPVYINRSKIYRIFFKATIRKASVILCQGKSSIPFLKTLTEVKIIHYPNYVLNNFRINGFKNLRDNNSVVHLVYFGRIVQSKNPLFLLSICAELKTMNLNFDMKIIGSGDKELINRLKSEIIRFGLQEKVEIVPPLRTLDIKKRLAQTHFFLFPSREKREGHSNSLTEAMAMGVVPICSNAGFNKEIVKNQHLIINDFDAKKYANRILEIWESNNWPGISEYVTKRVSNNFTEDVAKKILTNVYNS